MKTIIFNSFFVLLLLSISLSISAQIGFVDIDSDFYQLRVKNPDEFMQRFNYEQTPRGKTLVYADSLKLERLKYIQRLFHSALLRKAQKDSLLAKTIISFVKTTIDSTYLLSYYSDKWNAELLCDVTYKNKKQKIKLFLKTETDSLRSKWVIDSCSGNLFNIQPKDSLYFIGPANHNLNFMELKKMNKFKNNSISNFKSNHFIQDNVSILFFLIHNKLLSIDNIETITYNFYQIPGYYFKVEKIRDESSNSGWLITDIKKDINK